MNKKQVIDIAQHLVEISIDLHKKNKLSKYNLNDFYSYYLKEYVNNEIYYSIIIEYCRLLAESGYEIKIDTDNFDIMDYNSMDYELYIESILNKLPKNYDELQNIAKQTASKIIKRYKSKKYINQSFQKYLDSVIPEKYTLQEKITIEVSTVHYITQNYYDISNTDPFILNKFI